MRYLVPLVLTCVAGFLVLLTANAQQRVPKVTIEALPGPPEKGALIPATESIFVGFRPCKVERDKDGKVTLDETPFGANSPPPFPSKGMKMAGNRYRWHLNEATGEFLYKRLGKSTIGLFFVEPKTGTKTELKGTDDPKDAK